MQRTAQETSEKSRSPAHTRGNQRTAGEISAQPKRQAHSRRDKRTVEETSAQPRRPAHSRGDQRTAEGTSAQPSHPAFGASCVWGFPCSGYCMRARVREGEHETGVEKLRAEGGFSPSFLGCMFNCDKCWLGKPIVPTYLRYRVSQKYEFCVMSEPKINLVLNKNDFWRLSMHPYNHGGYRGCAGCRVPNSGTQGRPCGFALCAFLPISFCV